MSILEKIKEAENKAEQFKTEAKEEVNHLLAKRSAEDELKVKEMLDQANKKIEDLSKETNEKINELSDKVNQEFISLCQKDEKNALNHQNEAVDFILKKVTCS